MTDGTDHLGSYRGVARRDPLAAVPEQADGDLGHNGSVLRTLREPGLSEPALGEPVLEEADWPSRAEPPLAEHPLLHGLLLELPAKGSSPDPVWLDRWFEAARSILELIYAQSAYPHPGSGARSHR